MNLAESFKVFCRHVKKQPNFVKLNCLISVLGEFATKCDIFISVLHNGFAHGRKRILT